MSESASAQEGNEAICILISHGLVTPWERHLKHAGLSVRLVLPQDLARLAPTPPHLVFFDTTCDGDSHALFKRMLVEWGEARPVVLALVASHEGAVAASDLRAARELEAFDILMSESRPTTIATRVHFALLSATPAIRESVRPPEISDARATPSSYRERRKGGRLWSRVFDHDVLRERAATLLAMSGPRGLAAILVDLDRFKQIASRYGRKESEAILAATAERIDDAVTTCAPQNGASIKPFIARLAADEFIILLPGITSREAAAHFAHAVLRAVAAPLRQEDDTLYLSASAGIASAPRDAVDAEGLLRAVQAALTHAKQRAGSSFAFYTPHVAATQAHRLEIEHRLRQAMATGELLLYYQPQAMVASGEIIGFEALVRWNHPELGLVSPESFIGIAEEAGITAELGRWAVSRALGEIADLERRGLPPLKLSINISADMFAMMGGRGLAEHTLEQLSAAGLPAERLTLEVTERSLVAKAPQTLRAIDRLKTHGVRFALDDFGTGYSSLSYLKAFPIDEIKIDRSFILGAGMEDIALLRAIISLAKTLGMSVVAEGVETVEQLQMLKEESCDLYQGYYCAPALPAGQLIDIVTRSRNTAPA